MDQSRRNDAALAAAKAQAANSAQFGASSGGRLDGTSSLSKASKSNLEEKKQQEA